MNSQRAQQGRLVSRTLGKEDGHTLTPHTDRVQDMLLQITSRILPLPPRERDGHPERGLREWPQVL